MSGKLLIACDSESIYDLITGFAETEGFSVCGLCDIDTDTDRLMQLYGSQKPDIIILGEGYTECKERFGDTPVYILSAALKGERIISLPLKMTGLAAVLSEHAQSTGADSMPVIDSENSTLRVDEKVYKLTVDEAQVMKCFLNNPNRVFSRDQLTREVFGADAVGCEIVTDAVIERLKTILDGLSSKWSLKLIWGIGYKYEVMG